MTNPTVKTRNRAVLIAINNGVPYREVGRMHGISRSGVAHIVDKARKDAAPFVDELTARVRNALEAAGCEITPQAVAKRFTMTELKRVPNIGVLSIKQLKKWLVKHGQKAIQ